jgi:hypothetical protein
LGKGAVQYSFENFKPNQFFVGFDFVIQTQGHLVQMRSSRLPAIRSWHFNKNKSYHFVTRLNAGYFYSDLEEDMFKKFRTLRFFFLKVGFPLILKKLPISLNVGTELLHHC